jgi:hypothetical protein
MLFYICSWGNERPWEWAQGTAQLWRTDFDISLERDHAQWGRMVRNFESNALSSVFTAPNKFAWSSGVVFETEWPENLRHGVAKLELRRLFAGLCHQHRRGRWAGRSHSVICMSPPAGTYKVELTYVQNGLGDKRIGIQVNDAAEFTVKALMRDWNWVTISVSLHSGDNTVTVSYSGKGAFDIDKIRLLR